MWRYMAMNYIMLVGMETLICIHLSLYIIRQAHTKRCRIMEFGPDG